MTKELSELAKEILGTDHPNSGSPQGDLKEALSRLSKDDFIPHEDLVKEIHEAGISRVPSLVSECVKRAAVVKCFKGKAGLMSFVDRIYSQAEKENEGNNQS